MVAGSSLIADGIGLQTHTRQTKHASAHPPPGEKIIVIYRETGEEMVIALLRHVQA